MRVNIVWYDDIPNNPNRGLFQRLRALSESDYECVLYTSADSDVPPRIARHTRVERMPETGVPTIVATILFKLWVIYSIWKAKESGGMVYTINALDYSTGFVVSRLFDQAWLIDAFHSPYYYFDFGRARGDPITILRGTKTILVCKLILWDVDVAFVMAHSRDEGFARLLTTRFNVSREAIIAIPDGVDIDSTMPDRGKPQRDNGDVFEIYHIGLINNFKGLDMLRGLSDLDGKYTDIKVTMIGGVNPNFESEFERYEKRAAIQIEMIDYLPHDKLLERLRDADVGVCTLQPEIRDYRHSHPVKVFEYLATGKPVVATGYDSMREIVKDGVNGYTYPPRDANAFAERILELYADEAKRRKMADNARESVQKYDWGRINTTMMTELQERYPPK